MTYNKTKYITGALGFGLALVTLSGCQDDLLYERDENRYDGNMLLFEAGVSAVGDLTRSADPTDLEPLVMQGGEKPLYLHRYVCDNSFDPAYMDSTPETRGVQVNDMANFLEVHKTFGFQANFKEGNQVYVTPVESNLIEKELDNDGKIKDVIWGAKGGSLYWPGDNAMLSIHAWAPYQLPNTLTKLNKQPGRVSFTYEAQKSADGQTDAQAQTDLLWAITDCNKSMSVDGRAVLQFTHPLSAIKFAVRDVIGGTVESISIKGVYGKGDCTYYLEADGNGVYGNTLNNQYIWGNHSDPSDYTQKFGLHVDDYWDMTDKKDQGITEKKPEATFMMIPQEIPDDAVIEIKISPDVKGEVKEGTYTLTGKIKDLEVPEWKAGKEYVYTISTSTLNWTNRFEVKGSYRNNTEIYMPSPADETEFYAIAANKNYQPYYEVVSYRFRTNNPTVKENLPWTATHGPGIQRYYTKIYKNFAEKDAIEYLDRPYGYSERDSVPGNQWITDLSPNRHSGEGGLNADRHTLSFRDAHVTSDWNGDIKMYKKTPYEGNSESNPWNLATFGGNTAMNTANCYVVDREGWYSIPLYYGNAIKNGTTNTGAWSASLSDTRTATSTQEDYTKKKRKFEAHFRALNHFKDHRGNLIPNDGKIPSSYYNSALLLWQDVYNIIDQVKLVGDKIVFHVNRDNIQQGNAVIGLSEHTADSWNASDPKIVWSWHIWINEHWLNNKGVSNAFATSGFDRSINSVSQMQEQGDVEVESPRTTTTFTNYQIAPYNIGWCDAKNVRYLSRYNTMHFVQFIDDPDGRKKTGKTAELPIIQDGRTIEYLIGNNTYYQFGRKDPFVGFHDTSSTLKDDFGSLRNKIEPQLKTLSYSIQRPNEIFLGATNGDTYLLYNDWCNDGWQQNDTVFHEYYNLWNNRGYDMTKHESKFNDDKYHRCQKTIYDPSPAGYLVPPAGLYTVLFNNYNSVPQKSGLKTESALLQELNGVKLDDLKYRIWARKNSTEFFTLTATGNRWWANSGKGPGHNFNGQICYLWTCSPTTSNKIDRSGISIAIGKDGDNGYLISANFAGRKVMGRPIRCVRE